MGASARTAGQRSAAVPARLRWALDVLDPQPGEHVLELGCGPGVAAALVCGRRGDGRLLALDRSATAVDRARRRGAEHVAAGRLEVRQQALADLSSEPASFDAAFCVDVNAFWVRDAARELTVLRQALRPGGRLLLLYGGGGPTAAERVQAPVEAALAAHGFTEVRRVSGDAGFGVVSRRPGPPPPQAVSKTR